MSRGEYMERTARWIRESRAALGITQADLAVAIGASEASVSNWETGKGMINAYSRDALVRYFKANAKGARKGRMAAAKVREVPA